MRRRTFLASLPAAALAASASAQTPQTRGQVPGGATSDQPEQPRVPSVANTQTPARPDVTSGDRITGASFGSRSAAWGAHGAAATAHPIATLMAIDVLRRGGSAVDAAVAVNAALGFLEPVGCGIGGDCFVMLWDPRARRVMGLNGSGRSPRGLTLEIQRQRARDGRIWRYGAASVSVPGAVDAWWTLHQRYGRLPWAEVLEPAAVLAEEGAPVPSLIAYYLRANLRRFTAENAGLEEVENARRVYMPGGATPAEGEIFRNADLARTYRRIGQGGRDVFYQGEIAEQMERYFRRIGGWMTRADLSAHRSEWTDPLRTTYRDVEVYGLGPNSQGLSTLQMLNIMERFDMRAMGLLSTASIHHQAEAKRLAFEDRARYFADPAFYQAPLEQLNSKGYAAERVRLIRPDRINADIRPGAFPTRGDTTYFTVADRDGMMVSIIQSNYRGMGSGLVPDGADGRTLGFMFQDRGELFDLTPGRPNSYAPGKRPFQTIIPGFAVKNGEPWLSFGVMGGDMQPQGQAQIIADMVDYDLDLQAAGDCPRWHHEGSPEPTGEPADGIGTLRLETGVPEATKRGLQAIGWRLGASDGGFGGYQAIERFPGRYAAATEMRKDGVALAY